MDGVKDKNIQYMGYLNRDIMNPQRKDFYECVV